MNKSDGITPVCILNMRLWRFSGSDKSVPSCNVVAGVPAKCKMRINNFDYGGRDRDYFNK
jgi:hypothetical protein